MSAFRLSARFCLALTTVVALLACTEKAPDDSTQNKPKPLKPEAPLKKPDDPEPVKESKPVLIRGARIMTAAGKTFSSGYLLMEDGRIQGVGKGKGKAPENATIIEASGKVVTPGIIDTHSHIGVYPYPEVGAHEDGNEMTDPTTPEVWAEHSFWPQDPAIWRALSGGVTTIQVLPGSGNLIGGRAFVAKLNPRVSARAMGFPGAPEGVKMACGENPKGVYAEKGGPMTRMGNVAGYRHAFYKAVEYKRQWETYRRDKKHWDKRVSEAEGDKKTLREIGDPPDRPQIKPGMETLVGVLKGDILPQIHCYRADEMAVLLDLAEEFGFEIRAFHHALEAYKLRGRLAKENVGVSTWADWWGFKMEAFDGVPQNAALIHAAGGRPAIQSDSPTDIRHLNQEAVKAAVAGKKIGVGGITRDDVLGWLTRDGAWMLGVEDQVGTLEKGKMADVVIWNGDPFSVYSHAERVFIDGKEVFHRGQDEYPRSDFEVAIREPGLADADGKAAQTTQDLKSVPKLSALDVKRAKKAPQKGRSRSFLIESARVLVGDGSVLEPASVLVQDGHIAKVKSGKIEAGEDVARISAEGKVLTPGLIETRTQLGLFEVGSTRTTVDTQVSGKPVTPAFRAVDGFNPDSVRIPIARESGVTSAIGSPTGALLAGKGLFFQLSDAPRSEKPFDPAVAMFGGVGESAARSQGQSRGGVWLRLREILDDVAFYRQNRRGFEAGQSRELSLDPLHLQALIPVVKGEIPLVLEAHRASDIRAALKLRAGLREKGQPLRLVIAGGSEAWVVADALAEAQVPVILTPSVQAPRAFETLRARDDAATILTEAGVPVILSSSTWANNVRRLRQEAGIAVSYGLSHAEALESVTLTPARVFGRSDALGSIAVGKRANLVLWSGDPFELTSVAERVWINGRRQPLSHRQLELSRRYKNRK